MVIRKTSAVIHSRIYKPENPTISLILFYRKWAGKIAIVRVHHAALEKRRL
jgi:hypothetical protein